MVAQRAADAAIAHLDQRLVGMAEISSAVAHEIRVYVHFRHIVHEDSNATPFAVVKGAIQKRGLPWTEKAPQYGDGTAGISVPNAIPA